MVVANEDEGSAPGQQVPTADRAPALAVGSLIGVGGSGQESPVGRECQGGIADLHPVGGGGIQQDGSGVQVPHLQLAGLVGGGQLGPIGMESHTGVIPRAAHVEGGQEGRGGGGGGVCGGFRGVGGDSRRAGGGIGGRIGFVGETKVNAARQADKEDCDEGGQNGF